ncbi:MAG: hypothetical protein ABI183_04310 [Polyangiaceae bacterium]
MLRSTVIAIALFSATLGPCDKVKALLGQAPPATNDSSDTQLTAQPIVSPEDQLLTEATQLCTAGDCQSAHDRLAVGLPQNSPVRQSPAFKDLENKWATAVVAGATDDPDLMARRQELSDVIASVAVTPQLKAQAAQTLAALPTKPPPPPDAGPTPLASADGANLVPPKKGGKKHH